MMKTAEPRNRHDLCSDRSVACVLPKPIVLWIQKLTIWLQTDVPPMLRVLK